MTEDDSLNLKCAEKLQKANELLAILSDLKDIKGLSKVTKQIEAEKLFLNKLVGSGGEKEKVMTTNLTYLEALVNAALESTNCVALLEPFRYKEDGYLKRIVVDVVSENGQVWTKVTARNPKSLMMSWRGDSHFGSRTILDQAIDYVRCAAENPVLYEIPHIVFKFSSGINTVLANQLSHHGIKVIGELIPVSNAPVCSDESGSGDEHDIDIFNKEADMKTGSDSENVRSCTFEPCEGYNSEEDEGDTSGTIHGDFLSQRNAEKLKLNLDITALIAYVSEMTNGGTCQVFRQEPLTLQAKNEQTCKVKEELDRLFEGRKLYSCETAVSRFREIVATVGGEMERERAAQLLEQVTVVPDHMSERVKDLRLGGQIKERARIVFGTGDFMQALTVSANRGFCRSARHQGVRLATHFHRPRALSEQASEASQHRQQGS